MDENFSFETLQPHYNECQSPFNTVQEISARDMLLHKDQPAAYHTDMFVYFQWCVIFSARLTLLINGKLYFQYNGQDMPLVI